MEQQQEKFSQAHIIGFLQAHISIMRIEMEVKAKLGYSISPEEAQKLSDKLLKAYFEAEEMWQNRE
jgi:hypothetical protein